MKYKMPWRCQNSQVIILPMQVQLTLIGYMYDPDLNAVVVKTLTWPKSSALSTVNKALELRCHRSWSDNARDLFSSSCNLLHAGQFDSSLLLYLSFPEDFSRSYEVSTI